MQPILVELPQSPWSEKARWALDHHRVRYHSVEHVPLVYEPLLRLASREARRKPTVPMLFDGNLVVRDSFAIARHVDQHGSGDKLIPSEHDAEITRWNDRVEELMQNARARVVQRIPSSTAALRDELPSFLRPFGRVLTPVARLGLGFVAHKFDTASVASAPSEAAMASVLESAQAAIARGPYLVGNRFTFADVALACGVDFVAPHPRSAHSPAGREVWCEPKLAAAFPDVVAWRDRIIERHR
ncbi:MAG: glutathione S-transferase family protein [Myxococcales bacterium]|nr:glutathione S-transferase family protein [Myxococcales bacterium]